MRRHPPHLLPPTYGARRSSLIYPASRARSDGRPRRIRCYKICSIDTGLWCWDATTPAASDNASSQCRAWRLVLSFSYEVCVRQGRVTLPCQSLRGVRALNISHLQLLEDSSWGISYIPPFALPVVNGTVLHVLDRPSFRLCASETWAPACLSF